MDDGHDKSIIGRDADAAPAHPAPDPRARKGNATSSDDDGPCGEESDLDIVFEVETQPHGAH